MPVEPTDSSIVSQASARLERTLFEVKRVIVGQDRMVERLMVCLLARGHCLLEGVPGLAKTLTVRTMCDAIHAKFARVQFTPDLLPADLVGTVVYNQPKGEFTSKLGPIFANLVLADEINRAPAKVQSALLEAMQERQVTIGGHSHALPRPFLVMATQNPVEHEGTYPLPEAQTDRFLFKLIVDYPTEVAEHCMLKRWGQITRQPELRAVSSAGELLALRSAVDGVYVSDDLQRYVLALVRATRALAGTATNGASAGAKRLAYGASPRATLALVQAARALAFIRGQDFATPAIVQELVLDAVRHRIGLTYEAEAEQITPDQILRRVVETTPVPERA